MKIQKDEKMSYRMWFLTAVKKIQSSEFKIWTNSPIHVNECPEFKKFISLDSFKSYFSLCNDCMVIEKNKWLLY